MTNITRIAAATVLLGSTILSNGFIVPSGSRTQCQLSVLTMDNTSPDMDWDAYERKNMSRKKFGLQPLTPEQFLEVDAQVKQMEIDAIKQHAAAAAAQDATEMPRDNRNKGGFLGNIFADILEDTCDSNFDCERPQVCCDFGFKKMCCSSGQQIYSREGEPALIRVPASELPRPGGGDQTPRGGYY